MDPGDTIYVAGGTYGPLNINDSGTAGNPITIKRATVADQGTQTGWNAAYDTRVIIDGGGANCAICIGTTVNSNYITVDGATRYGIWGETAHAELEPEMAARRIT